MNKHQLQLRQKKLRETLEAYKLAEWETWAASMHHRHFYAFVGFVYMGLVCLLPANILIWGTLIYAAVFVKLIGVVWKRGEQLREYNELLRMLDFIGSQTENVKEEG